MSSLGDSKPSIRDIQKPITQRTQDVDARTRTTTEKSSKKKETSGIVKKKHIDKNTQQHVPQPKNSSEKPIKKKGIFEGLLDDVALAEINKVEEVHEDTPTLSANTHPQKKVPIKKTGFMGGIFDESTLNEIDKIETEQKKHTTQQVSIDDKKVPQTKKSTPLHTSSSKGLLGELNKIEKEQQKTFERTTLPQVTTPEPKKSLPEKKASFGGLMDEINKVEHEQNNTVGTPPVSEEEKPQTQLNNDHENKTHVTQEEVIPINLPVPPPPQKSIRDVAVQKKEMSTTEAPPKKQKNTWEEVRNEYRGHSMQMILARGEFKKHFVAYEREKENSSLVAKFIDNKPLKHAEAMAQKAQGDYRTVLEKIREERSERTVQYVERIRSEVNTSPTNNTLEYVALHEMLLEKQVEIELKTLERIVREGVKETESGETTLEYSDICGAWLKAQPRYRRMKYGAMFGVVLDGNTGSSTRVFSSLSQSATKPTEHVPPQVAENTESSVEHSIQSQANLFPQVPKRRNRNRRGLTFTSYGTDDKKLKESPKSTHVEPEIDRTISAVQNFIGIEEEDIKNTSSAVLYKKNEEKVNTIDNLKKEVDNTKHEVPEKKKVVPFYVKKLEAAKARYASVGKKQETNPMNDTQKDPTSHELPQSDYGSEETESVTPNSTQQPPTQEKEKPQEIQDILNQYLGTASQEKTNTETSMNTKNIESRFREFLLENNWVHQAYPGITEEEVQTVAHTLYEDYLKKDPRIVEDLEKHDGDWEAVFIQGTHTIYVDKHLIDHVIHDMRTKKDFPTTNLEEKSTTPDFEEVQRGIETVDDGQVYEEVNKPLKSKSVAEETLQDLRFSEDMPVPHSVRTEEKAPIVPSPQQAVMKNTEVVPPTFEEDIQKAKKTIHEQGEDYYGEETREYIETLFSEGVLSGGIRPHVLSSWGPISHARLQDILDGGGSIRYAIGNNPPIAMGKSVEDVCKSVVLELEKQVDFETFETYKKKNISLGEFVKKVVEQNNIKNV